MADLSDNVIQDGAVPERATPCVLLLDDYACVRTLHGKVLDGEGIPSFQTGSEAEAWKFLGYPEVRVLIQDYTREPGSLGGLNFYERMSRCPIRRHIPVVIISGTGRQRITRAFSGHFGIPSEEIVILREKPMEFDDLRALSSTLRILLDLPPCQTS